MYKEYFRLLYDDNYKKRNFDRTDLLVVDRFSRIASIVGPSKRVLDYGGGDGELSRYLNNCDYSILDLSTEHKINNFKRIELLEGSSIAADDSSFDVVVLSEVMEHLYNVNETLSEVTRVLKHEGQLIITVPNVFSPFFFIKSIFNCHQDLSHEHLYWFDWSLLSNIGRAHGYIMEKRLSFCFLPGRLYKKFYFVDKLLSKIFPNNCSQLLCVFRLNKKNV